MKKNNIEKADVIYTSAAYEKNMKRDKALLKRARLSEEKELRTIKKHNNKRPKIKVVDEEQELIMKAMGF